MQQEAKRQALRKMLIAARDAMSLERRAAASSALTRHLARTMSTALGPLNRLCVGAYYPIGSEPDITSLFNQFDAVALPSVTARDSPLTFLRYRAGAELIKEGFGIAVPARREVLHPSILLVPCVGFQPRPDGRIDRLGYGGGFYDRTLARGRWTTIGISFKICQLTEFEPHEHDMPLDGVITEAGLQGLLARHL